MDIQKEQQLKLKDYLTLKYDTKERFSSYWHQINEIIALTPSSVLEAGVGNKFVYDYLKKNGLNVTGVDCEKRLNPDVVADVCCLPFGDNSFDLVSCCQTLEHLPFEEFLKALKEIKRVARKNAVISIPDSTRIYPFSFKLPKIGCCKIIFRLPRFKAYHGEKGTVHYWEIGRGGFPLEKITKSITGSGFSIIKSFNVFENPFHKFFILKKQR
ncbi:MAG: methyltransferase domain-containing protein [Candidatus Omnitrophota bacterium]